MQFLLIIFSGLLAFAVLDRLTGSWSVVNTQWAADFIVPYMTVPGVWFLVSFLLWFIVGFVVFKYSKWTWYLNQGVTTVRIRYEKKIFTEKVYELLSTKKISYEERGISSDGFEIVKFTYPEEDWSPGNGTPIIVVEFDLTNNFLLTVQITYNRLRVNNKELAFTARDLQKRLLEEFNTMKIWDTAGEDHSATALAIDKRRALEEREAAEAEEGEEG